MGDRCMFEVLVAKEHADKARKIVGEEEVSGCLDQIASDSGDKLTAFFTYEVNYGGSEETDALEAEHIPYVAWNGPGDEYGAAITVFDGKEHASVDSLSGGVMPVVRTTFRNGVPEIHPDEAVGLENFYRVLRNMESAWGVQTKIGE